MMGTMSIIDVMDDPALLAPWFSGDSWSAWRAILKAAFALPMTDAEVEQFRAVAERDPPKRRVRELWVIAGRRAGKDSIASLVACYSAAFVDYSANLRPGESALVLCLAVDRAQARIVFNYTRAYFDNIPMLGAMVTRPTMDGLELLNSVEIVVGTNDFRGVRGRPIAVAVFDECAFWSAEGSALPDKETYRAVMPGLGTIPGAMLIGITTPYRKSGLAYEKLKASYGKADDDILVVKAPSLTLNKTLDPIMIEKALADDPEGARAEWLGEFRDDIAAYVDREVVEAAIVPGRRELGCVAGITPVGLFDAAGGSGGDSFASAVAHFDQKAGRAVLDAIRERRPPFSPEATIKEHAEFFKSYGIHRVTSDRWGGEFPAEQFKKHGIACETSERVKSEIYREALPLLNSGKVELLDHPRLVSQICGLERRTARGGKDSIDHAPGAHDDIANSALGALVLAAASPAPLIFTQALMEWSRRRPAFTSTRI